MGFFDLFAGSKTVSKAATDILDKDNGLITQFGSWVGNMNLTDEDIMENNSAIVKSVHEFVKDTLEESTSRSQARRSIATMWIKLQVLLVLLTAVTIPLNTKIAEAYFELATSSLMISVTTAISIFFFGSYALVRHNKSKT